MREDKGNSLKRPPAAPPSPPAIALADILSFGVTLSLPQACMTKPLEAER